MDAGRVFNRVLRPEEGEEDSLTFRVPLRVAVEGLVRSFLVASVAALFCNTSFALSAF